MRVNKSMLAGCLPLIFVSLSVFFLRESIEAVLITALAVITIEVWLWGQTAKKVKGLRKQLTLLLPYALILLGSLGLVASINLTVEQIESLKDPDAIATCSISPIVACSPVIASEQASAFGIPNPVIGIAGFGALLGVSFGMIAGAKYAAWLWRIMWLASAFGIGFVGWLIYQALYDIGALCIYCMVTWAVVIPLFYYLSLYLSEEGHIRLPEIVATSLRKYHLAILTATYGLIVILIYFRFQDYWNGLF